MTISRQCLVPVFCTGLCALASYCGAGPWLRLWLGAITLGTVAWAMIMGKVLAVPAEALMVTWCIPGSLHFLRLMYLGHIWPQYPLLYLVGFLASYLIGFYFPIVRREGKVRNPSGGETTVDASTLRDWSWLYDFCALLGLICALAAVGSGLSLTGGNYSDMSQVRQSFLNDSVSKWDYLVVLTSPPGIVAFVVGLLFQEHLNPLRRLIYIFSGLATVASAVAHAGRYAAVQIVILTLICLAMRRKQNLKALADTRLIMIVGATLIVLVAYMVALPYFRDESATLSYAELAASFDGVTVDSGLAQDVSAQGPMVRDALYAFYSYLAMPLENFRIFYCVYHGSPKLGALEGSIVAHQLSRIFPKIESPRDILLDRAADYANVGEAPTSWQTMASYMVIDFGWTGCLIAIGALGNFSRLVYDCETSTRSVPAALALAALCFYPVHSIMYSALASLDLLLLVLWAVVLRMIRGKSMIHCAPGLETPAYLKGSESMSSEEF